MDATTLKQRFGALRALVAGDLMIDRYVWGQATRLSPEAPVPVVEWERTEDRPGGAANVAANLKALGVCVEICGVAGQDDDGQALKQLLQAAAINAEGLLFCPDRPTTVKTRIMAAGQQLLRIDRESAKPMPADTETAFFHFLEQKLKEKIDLVVLEDYDKGFFSPRAIQKIIETARRAGAVTLADPKFAHFFDYAGITVFKPNLKELGAALGLSLKTTDLPSVQQAVAQLRRRLAHNHTLVTLGAGGILLADEGLNYTHLPAHVRQIVDVSGAGDTVAAVMGAALAAGCTAPEAARLANLSGGLVCETPGVTPVNIDRLLAEAF